MPGRAFVWHEHSYPQRRECCRIEFERALHVAHGQNNVIKHSQSLVLGCSSLRRSNLKTPALFLLASLAMSSTVSAAPAHLTSSSSSYLDYSSRDDVLSGGVKMIPIT